MVAYIWEMRGKLCSCTKGWVKADSILLAPAKTPECSPYFVRVREGIGIWPVERQVWSLSSYPPLSPGSLILVQDCSTNTLSSAAFQQLTVIVCLVSFIHPWLSFRAVVRLPNHITLKCFYQKYPSLSNVKSWSLHQMFLLLLLYLPRAQIKPWGKKSLRL